MNDLCEKHGLIIVTVSGHYPDIIENCEECHIEMIKKNMKGHSKDTIARWIFKNSMLSSEVWASSSESGQLYTLDELKGIKFDAEFYTEEMLPEKSKRLDLLEASMRMEVPEYQDYVRDKYGEDALYDLE